MTEFLRWNAGISSLNGARSSNVSQTDSYTVVPRLTVSLFKSANSSVRKMIFVFPIDQGSRVGQIYVGVTLSAPGSIILLIRLQTD